MDKIRAAVVGTGFFGSLHARFYKECFMTDLVAVVNRSEKNGRDIANLFQVPWYTDPETLLKNEDFELVSICTREQSHLQLGLLFAGAGKKIFMEKPLAPTLEASVALVEGINQMGSFMAVNYILRHDPRFLELKKRSDEGELGDHISYYARRRGCFEDALHYGTWTDLLLATAIHDIDLMIWYNGSKPIRVYAESIIKKCVDIRTEDAVVATIKFENGTIGCIESSWVMPATAMPWSLDCSFNLVGTKGGACVEGANNGLQIFSANKYNMPDLTHWPVLATGLSGDLYNAMKSAVNSIICKEDPFMTGDEAIKSHKVAFAMKESLKRQKPVIIE